MVTALWPPTAASCPSPDLLLSHPGSGQQPGVRTQRGEKQEVSQALVEIRCVTSRAGPAPREDLLRVGACCTLDSLFPLASPKSPLWSSYCLLFTDGG